MDVARLTRQAGRKRDGRKEKEREQRWERRSEGEKGRL